MANMKRLHNLTCELQALVSERVAMHTENVAIDALGETPKFDEAAFRANAEAMRALKIPDDDTEDDDPLFDF